MPNGGQLGSFENVLEFPCLSAAPRAVQKSARAVLWPAYGRAGEDMLCQWNPAGPRRKNALASTFLWLAELTTKRNEFKGFSAICRIIGERCQHFTMHPMICAHVGTLAPSVRTSAVRSGCQLILSTCPALPGTLPPGTTP